MSGQTAPMTSTADAVPRVSDRRRIGLRLAALGHWLLLRLLAVAVFVGGVAIGHGAYLRAQPAPAPSVGAAGTGTPTPPIVREFVTALRDDDQAALRSAVPGEPYLLLIVEMDRWEVAEMTDVKVLGTAVDGPRTATAIVVSGTGAAGEKLAINLVVHTSDGRISSFR